MFGTNSHSSLGDISKLLDATRPSVFSSFSCNISFICGIFREVLVHHHAATTAPTLTARVPQYMEGTYSCFMVHSLRLVKTKTIHLPAATSPQDNLLVLVLRKRGRKYIIVVLYEQGLRRAENAMEFSYYLIHPPARSGKEANPLCLPSLMASGPASTRDWKITLSRDSIMHAL